MWAILAACAVVSAAEKLPKADHTPAAATAHQKAVIAEGIALHDRGDYPGAIAKYKEVLNESPDEVGAMHELAYSYFTNKEYASALATARRGILYRSALLPRFYAMLGNSLDELDRRDEAIEVYKAAIKQSPSTALLHFNLGLSLMRSGKYAEAKQAMEKSASVDPSHASSHFLLASLYNQLGYRVPAILALSCFLLIEPDSARAREALPTVTELVGGRVTKGDKPNQINIIFGARF